MAQANTKETEEKNYTEGKCYGEKFNEGGESLHELE